MFDENAPISVGRCAHESADKTGPVMTHLDSPSAHSQVAAQHASGSAAHVQADFHRAQFAQEQNLTLGFTFGLTAALAGAGVWALITALSGWQIGFMAIGVGFLVGYAVRLGGKGSDLSFGILGAGLALFGCLMGNLFTSCWFIAQQYQTSFSEVLFSLNGGAIGEIFVNTFSPMDLLFYAIAVHSGYKYSRIEQPKLEASVVK